MALDQNDSWALLHASVDEQTSFLKEILNQAIDLSQRTRINETSSRTLEDRTTLVEAEQNLNGFVRRAEATSKTIEERLFQLSINPIYNGRRIQINNNNAPLLPIEKQFLIEKVQIMTDIIKINHVMRDIRTLVAKLSDTKRKSDIVISRQSFMPDRNEQTLTMTRPNDNAVFAARAIGILAAVAALAAVHYFKPR